MVQPGIHLRRSGSDHVAEPPGDDSLSGLGTGLDDAAGFAPLFYRGRPGGDRRILPSWTKSGSMVKKTPVLIIGAGPYGLSLGHFLHARQTPFLLVGKTMELWRNHTFDSMKLRSDYATSILHDPYRRYSFERFARVWGTSLHRWRGRLPVTVFRQYIDWCERQFPFRPEEQYVMSLQQAGPRFRARLQNGDEVVADRVVVATGIAHHLHLPPELSVHPRVIHSYHSTSIQALQNCRVLVVGAGQSAAESLAVLQNQGNQVEWYARTPPVFYSEPLNLPKPLFDLILRLPGMLHRLPPRWVHTGLNRFSATTITPDFRTALTGMKRHTLCPPVNDFDVVVAATGYRYRLEDQSYLHSSLRRKIRTYSGLPLVNQYFASSVPGLHFLGAMTEPFFGPSMKFMIGSGYAARVLSHALA
ncbi:MAG: NAD(P)/FAD-dependent oxidoreductase [Candidatus Neomarinimicrobiota bacterium]|nr:MAG: NAD(P)/FAD-dependent oxidoreductase [Candidatus Neomarinimicrobiota bacterium]